MYFRFGQPCCYFRFRSLSQSSGDTFFDVAVVGKLDFVTWIRTILILDLLCHILVNVTIKFRQFQKIHTCLTSRQTTSGAPIGDLIIVFCIHFIFRKSHERTAPNAEQKFFYRVKNNVMSNRSVSVLKDQRQRGFSAAYAHLAGGCGIPWRR